MHSPLFIRLHAPVQNLSLKEELLKLESHALAVVEQNFEEFSLSDNALEISKKVFRFLWFLMQHSLCPWKSRGLFAHLCRCVFVFTNV